MNGLLKENADISLNKERAVREVEKVSKVGKAIKQVERSLNIKP